MLDDFVGLYVFYSTILLILPLACLITSLPPHPPNRLIHYKVTTKQPNLSNENSTTTIIIIIIIITTTTTTTTTTIIIIIITIIII